MRWLRFALLALVVSGCSAVATTPIPETASPTSISSPALPAPTISPPASVTVTEAPAAMSPVTRFPDAQGYSWKLVTEGLNQPLDLQHAGDDRLFIVEKGGTIRVVEGGVLRPKPFLDIRDRVGSRGSEQGLLGLAFHPLFSANGFFFVNYTDLKGNTVVSRFRVSADPAYADPGSERIILQVPQPYPNHNGGALAFGPDAMLYIGLGDGGAEGDPLGNGQRLDTLLGKILRVDVDSAEPYAIPANNPFALGGGRPEIWAYGLRNPWRFSFDPRTGDMFVGDVGQDKWEEIDYLAAGSPGGTNFGWNLREGAHPYKSEATSGLTDPIAEYSHAEGCSVTGGVVVRSPSLPEWNGIYLFGDYCSGRIWGLLRDSNGAWQKQVLYHTDFSIVSFGVDSKGEVYLVDLNGAIYRLERVG